MDFKKDLSNVAAEVAKIMEAELSAKQKKIAQMSEPKHKIDAGDLAKLRAGHKPVKEETITEDDLPITTKKPKTVTVKHKTSGKELNVVDTPSVREKYKTMGYHPMKEEVVEEGIEDRIEAARKKAKAAGKPMKEPKKEVPMKRRVEGKAYGGAKQKEEMEESTMPFTAMLEAYTEHGLSAFIVEENEKPGHTSAYTHAEVEDGVHQDVDDVKEMHKKIREAAKKHGGTVHYTERPTLSGGGFSAHSSGPKEFHQEVKKIVKDYPHVGAEHEMIMKEEVDYLEEEKDGKIDLTHAFKQHGLHYHMTDYYTNSGARKGRSVKSHEEAMKRIHKKVSDDHGPKVAEDMHKHSQSMANSWYRGDDAPKSAAALRAKHKVKWDGDIDKVDDKPDPKFHKEEVDNETFTKEVETNKKKNTGELRNEKGVAAAATQSVAVQKEEVEQVEERTLTEPEMKKKEEVVKSMKKNLKGFKERYGERAKSVMYATATKMAKKD